MANFWSGAISRIDLAESRLREQLSRRLRSLPAIRAFKSQKQMVLLREVAELQTQERMSFCVVGGLAYDALAGHLTSIHSDIDLSLHYQDADEAAEMLASRGFAVAPKSAYAAGALREGQYLDLFYWRDAGEGRIEHVSGGTAVRMPRSFLAAGQEVELSGIRFRVPSNEYMVSTLPLIQKARHREFVAALPTRVTLECSRRRETIRISMEATVHEYAATVQGRRAEATGAASGSDGPFRAASGEGRDPDALIGAR
ncbi:MAG: hypothetical protein R2729_07720 [Bryobacteraceae bacterium]